VLIVVSEREEKKWSDANLPKRRQLQPGTLVAISVILSSKDSKQSVVPLTEMQSSFSILICGNQEGESIFLAGSGIPQSF